MPVIRVIVLWHQHQPFYKDLVTGEYRLPWVRLHALKDYYGMVKLLDEFPNVHQTFNLVPSLITQIQDYVDGTANDPFLQVAAKPAKDLSLDERKFAIQYLFQANPVSMIGRYPRYQELWERFRGCGDSPEKAEKCFAPQDFTDLQVLSQIAWFDEFFLEEPDIAALIKKGHTFSLEDQRFVISRERFLESAVGAMLVERAKLSKEFWQLSGEDMVNLADQAYRGLVDAHLRDLVPGRSPSEFLESFTTHLDNMGATGRATLLAFLRERYKDDGERRC